MANVSKLNLWLKHFLNQNNPTTFLNKTASAIAAEYRCTSNASFRNIGSENFTKHATKINKWLDDNGLSENALKIKLLSLMEAKEIKFFSHNGMIIDLEEVEALEVQRKSLDMAMKYKKMYPASRYEITGKDGGPLKMSLTSRLKQISESKEEKLKSVTAITDGKKSDKK